MHFLLLFYLVCRKVKRSYVFLNNQLDETYAMCYNVQKNNEITQSVGTAAWALPVKREHG